MKTIKTIGISIIIFLIPTLSNADEVKVDGKNYRCTNICSINSGPPMTIQDCCGGTVTELKKEVIVLDPSK